MNILFKVTAICFVLAVVNWVLTEIMTESMSDEEKALYIFNNTIPKRVAFFVICLCLSFIAMCLSLMGAIITM